jgi:hypothetical protein
MYLAYAFVSDPIPGGVWIRHWRLMSSAPLPRLGRPLSNEGFQASHSTASLALADILGRYIQLVAASCGRTSVGLMDAVEALEVLGVGWDELDEFASEARGRGQIGATKQLRGKH